MAEIVPFHGLRYAPAIAGEPGKLIAPPYDVINEPLRDALFHFSEYNISRVIKADRDATGGVYASAAALWRSWRDKGVVTPDSEPCIYVYEQLFEVHDRKFSRTGMIALAKLRDLGNGIMPHEKTLSGPRADRLELLRATKTQFGLVFALYPDPENAVDAILESVKSQPPLMQAADRDNQFHRLWAISNPEVIGRIQAIMQDKQLLIADGHHRYETALNYRNENPDCPAAQYRMMAFVNTANVGLVVLPTHRLLKALPGFKPAEFLAKARRHFEVRSYPGHCSAVRQATVEALHELQAEGKHAIALCTGDGCHYILVLRDLAFMNDVDDHSEAWRKLDVSILHHLLLEKLLGITQEQIAEQTYVEYVQDFPHAIDAAAERVHSGEAQALFLLNPTRIEEVMQVARDNERMPQKSTFFYPKVYTGLVFNALDK